MDYVFPIIHLIMGIGALYCAYSHKIFKQIEKNTDLETAKKSRKIFKICGFFLLLIGVVVIFIESF